MTQTIIRAVISIQNVTLIVFYTEAHYPQVPMWIATSDCDLHLLLNVLWSNTFNYYYD
ncbi:hypothetical protein [Chlorogloea sp. CCALA 695]|uniref:hypothetical protein n=1 Tax=Chlorogloea sp. CCALA 695 TaxID=2107693 RepID=UPI001304937C|nr:hypothetical protein [Chlorogloea sp. CCALA 695]